MSKQNVCKDQLDKNQELLALRHSGEHILTQAMIRLFGPERVIMAMGPATEEGFYFDFDSGEGFKLTEDEFGRIEKEMAKIIAADLPISRHEVSIAEARELFADNPYKQEWLDQIADRDEKISVYWTGDVDLAKVKTGESFVDLCKGPHASSTGQIKAFKLLSLAGAYWHGDEKNKMLTRVYGTAFPIQAELDNYLTLLDEAKKRDHRKLGKELDLFTFSELVGGGLPLWTPKGTILRHLLDDLVWKLRKERGYEQVTIPHITLKSLYEKSGHWAKFANDLFKIKTREGHEFAMKPMNCPHHTQIYAHLPRSYRDLPQRYAETTMVYRDEQSGELNGLSRVRCITQDDAHVFCRESQLKHEVFAIWDIIEAFYKACGFPELSLRLSLSDPKQMDKYLGTKEQWAQAEDQLRQFATERGAKYFEAVGEAAFYGPKLDFMTKDSLGREWQVATIQADRNMPSRFELTYTNEAGEKEQVVMIHAAIMGSIERFISILIEHHAGKFPFWLAPVQVKVLPITDGQHQYAQDVVSQLTKAKLRVELDDRSERLQAKIRDAQLQQIPYMLILGAKEVANQTVSVRSRDAGDLGSMDLTEITSKLQ
ncbi:MAG TPA: threonine--tRNA ligase [Candidatus Woesebacteria bacterium]|nr:threonine--tRNA ligase [Candidatus Woesebacteria bacterium]